MTYLWKKKGDKMLAGFILGLSVGIFIAGFVYIFMDSKLYELKNKYATVFKQSTNHWEK